jgi:hypothetical protein
MLISLMLKAVGLGLLDRLLGGVLGSCADSGGGGGGAGGGDDALAAGPMVARCVLAPPLETVVIAAKPWLPAEAAKRIRGRCPLHVLAASPWGGPAEKDHVRNSGCGGHHAGEPVAL